MTIFIILLLFALSIYAEFTLLEITKKRTEILLRGWAKREETKIFQKVVSSVRAWHPP